MDHGIGLLKNQRKLKFFNQKLLKWKEKCNVWPNNLNKIIDVKMFLAKEQTHIFSVSEVSFHRNELNPNATQFSTEILIDKLKIPGYTAMLPE